ncbi:MAG: aldo/keto reductase [Anaerolineales bacterium]|nr:aldo/keto reductase [Anaerolineales bacterium]
MKRAFFVRHAAREGTTDYKERFSGRVHPSHFKLANDIWISSIGLGIYLKEITDKKEADYRDVLSLAIRCGCNYLDAGIALQSQKSEQVIGQALASVFAKGFVARDEMIVSCRGGQIIFKGEYPESWAEYVREQLIDPGVAAADEFAHGWHHCMAPRYLRKQFRQCLTNLGLGTLDIYFIHYPEIHRIERGQKVFNERLRAAFAEFEAQIRIERLVNYGIATLDGFRVPPDDPAYLSLATIVELARDAGGSNHHFRYIQAPFNLAMREIHEYKNQIVNGKRVTLLQAANELGIVVIGASTLLQGQLTLHLPQDVKAAMRATKTSAQAAIQFARSAPGLTSAVVGMSCSNHIMENLAVSRLPLADFNELDRLIGNNDRSME